MRQNAEKEREILESVQKKGAKKPNKEEVFQLYINWKQAKSIKIIESR